MPVSATREKRSWSDEELESHPRDGYKRELLDGRIIMSPVHANHTLYFEYGTRLAWVVNWKREQVHIYRPDSIDALTHLDDLLSGEEVLPGFKCRLRRIFCSP